MNSINQHFIPQFHLKNFTNDKGYYFIFNKKFNKFEKGLKTPRTSFFIKNRNTIKINGIETIVLERLYHDFENNFAKFISYINSIDYDIDIIESISMINVLKCLIIIQFCRLPVYDVFMDNLVLNFDYTSSRNIFTDGNGKNILFEYDYISLIKNDKDFRYYFRCFIFPFLIFQVFNNNVDMLKWRIYNIEGKNNPFICSDVPIIFNNNLNDLLSFNGNILFPITKNRILIISENHFPVEFPVYFWEYVNMALYEQSSQYLAVLDKQYLYNLLDIYNDLKKINIPNIVKTRLFSFF